MLYEPAGAVIRAGGIAQLGDALDARLLHPDIAYLTADTVRPTPYATAFEVLEVHPYTEQTLRHWARDRGVGTLEIKKRGLDLDPAVLRKRLKLRGSGSATVVLTPWIHGHAPARGQAAARGLTENEPARSRGEYATVVRQVFWRRRQ